MLIKILRITRIGSKNKARKVASKKSTAKPKKVPKVKAGAEFAKTHSGK